MKDEREKIIEKYSEPIYRFCLKRLSCKQDAEDLAQEILLCVFKGYNEMEIKDVNAWVWKIARNRYARKIKNLNEMPQIISYNSMPYDLDDGHDIVDDMLTVEAHKMIFNALHSLSSLYRDILVEYYVHEKTCPEISKKYNIPLSSVKWRLYSGKSKLKERLRNNMITKTYERINLCVGCNGSFNPKQYLDTQIKKAIVMAAYDKPLTIEEISLNTGIPTLYLEDELEKLIYGEAINKIGNKYATNFIILKNSDNERIKKNLYPYIAEVTDKLEKTLKETEGQIKNIGFYGSDFGIQRLGYIIIPYIIRKSISIISESNQKLKEGPIPMRKDGGYGWFMVHEGESMYPDDAGCNQYFSNTSEGMFTYYWIGRYFLDELNRALKLSDYTVFKKLANMKEFNQRDIDDDLLANLIKVNIIKKTGNGYELNIPAFTVNEFEQFTKLFEPCISDLTSLLDDVVLKVWENFRACTPERLYDQINQYIIGYINSFVYFAVEELQKRKVLNIPDKDTGLTDNVFYIDKKLNYNI